MSNPPIIIRGKYQIISKIGQGKFGTVYKAINMKSKDVVAIKIENTDSRILKHETRMLNYLNKNKCLNVPLVHWYGIYDNIPCLVTPFYHYSLTQFIVDKKDKFNINILMQNMLDILKNCHELFVLHRDLKPDNFMFNYKNELILLDFGLAAFDNQEEDNKINSNFIGNVIYASPNIHHHNKAKKIDDIISVAYIYLLIYLGGKLPWMNINGNSNLLSSDINKLDKIENLKQIQNIYSCKTSDNKIFEFIKNAYNNSISYNF